jgi:EAL and modified HD-GYP domain-containing signal transduction protein
MSPSMLTAPLTQPLRQRAPNPQNAEVADFSVPRFITRQPLLDNAFSIIGYELKVNQAGPLPVLPGATSLRQIQDEALLVSVIDLEYQQALSRRLTLLNVNSETLDNPLLDKLPRESAILAVHPQNPTPALLARCQTLAREGYALALDEAALMPGMIPLAMQSKYLRFDAGGNDLMKLTDRLVRIQSIQGPRLIARNVENEETFSACRKLSFDLFQGYFFAQPGLARARGIDTSRLRIIKLLNLVMSHAEFPGIEAQFKLDPGLSLKMLRFINSVGVGLRYPVRSIGHALLMLGHDQLYRWLTLLLFTHQESDGRSQALLRNALVRARLTELLGQDQLAKEDRDGLFIAGILSMLEALLNLPMVDILAALNLSEPIVEVLLHGRGIYAPYLHLASAFENGDAATIGQLTQALGLSHEAVNLAHMNALIWSEGMDV